MIRITIKKEDNIKVAGLLMDNGIEYSSTPTEPKEEQTPIAKCVNLETPPVGDKKPFITANVRDVLDLYDRHQISHSRMVEMLNEMSFKWHKEQLNGKDAVERIVCAAILLVESGKIYYGHRHNNCLESASGELSWTMNRQQMTKVEKTQGFVTTKGRFVGREEAWVIAKNADQIIKQSGGEGTLYSEDLY